MAPLLGAKGRSRNVHEGDRKEAKIGQGKLPVGAAVKRPRRCRRDHYGGVILAAKKGKKAPGTMRVPMTWSRK
jgi:hypothetical protein